LQYGVHRKENGMSRTTGVVFCKIPGDDATGWSTVIMPESVTSISDPKIVNGQLKLVVGPTYLGSPGIRQPIYFAKADENPPPGTEKLCEVKILFYDRVLYANLDRSSC
jgi:hypothetical protein